MNYTPKLKATANITLKNLSGATGEPMTVTLDELLKFVPLILDSEKVCEECGDTTRCQECFLTRTSKETKNRTPNRPDRHGCPHRNILHGKVYPRG